MKITMSWGSWIVVSFVVFAVGTFAMVYIAMSTKVDLVSDDYYQQELTYQSHIDLLKNTAALSNNVEIRQTSNNLVISFPKSEEGRAIAGTMYFFRPSDKRQDARLTVRVDSANIQQLPLAGFSQGLWRIKISWTSGTEHYFTEVPFIIR